MSTRGPKVMSYQILHVTDFQIGGYDAVSRG